MDSEKEDLRVAYEEVSQLHSQQQGGIDLVYNKLNWILVSDIVFLVYLYGDEYANPGVIGLVTASALCALVGFQPERFKSTVKISALLEKAGEKGFMRSLIKRKKDAFVANNERTELMSEMMSGSRWFLIIALLLQLVVYFYQYHG